MKKFIFILTALVISSISAFANGNQEEPQLTKEQKQALQAKIDSIFHEEAIDAINKKAFTLEANQVTFKRGYTAYVNTNTNFVSLNGDDAVVQTAFNIPFSGFNGIGGITVDGKASNINTTTEKGGETTVTMSVMGVGISATVFIRLYKDSNRATVTISPDFNSNRITLSGYLMPIKKSNVFKGNSL